MVDILADAAQPQPGVLDKQIKDWSNGTGDHTDIIKNGANLYNFQSVMRLEINSC